MAQNLKLQHGQSGQMCVALLVASNCVDYSTRLDQMATCSNTFVIIKLVEVLTILLRKWYLNDQHFWLILWSNIHAIMTLAGWFIILVWNYSLMILNDWVPHHIEAHLGNPNNESLHHTTILHCGNILQLTGYGPIYPAMSTKQLDYLHFPRVKSKIFKVYVRCYLIVLVYSKWQFILQ